MFVISLTRFQNAGEAGPSFGRYLLENQNTHKLSYEEMAYLAGSLFGAGSDTVGDVKWIYRMFHSLWEIDCCCDHGRCYGRCLLP